VEKQRTRRSTEGEKEAQEERREYSVRADFKLVLKDVEREK